MVMDMDKLRRLAELKRLKSSKDGELKTIKEEIEKLEPQVLDMFAEEGVDGIKVTNGVRPTTLFPKRDVRAHALQGPEGVVEACKAAGLEEFIHPTVNMNTLSAYLRDLEKAGEDLPPEFEGKIVAFEKFSVGARAS